MAVQSTERLVQADATKHLNARHDLAGQPGAVGGDQVMVLEQNCAGADLRHLVGDVKIVNRSREEVRSLRIRVNVQVDHAFRHRIGSHLGRRRSGLC